MYKINLIAEEGTETKLAGGNKQSTGDGCSMSSFLDVLSHQYYYIMFQNWILLKVFEKVH